MTPDVQELYVETQTRTNCNSLFSRQIRLAKTQLRERRNRKGRSLTSNVSHKSTCFHLHKIESILHNVGMKSGLWHSLTANSAHMTGWSGHGDKCRWPDLKQNCFLGLVFSKIKRSNLFFQSFLFPVFMSLLSWCSSVTRPACSHC